MASPDATSSPAPPRTPWGLFVPILVILLAGAGYLGWTAWDRATTPTLAALEQAFNSGETARAERDAEHYLRRHPGDAPALLILAKTRLKHDDYRGAAEALAAVPAASIHKTEALFREGQAWKKLGQGRRARRALTAAVLRDPRGQGPAMNARMELLALFAMEERREAFDALAWETYAALAPENRISVLVMRTRLDYEQTAPDVNAKSLQPFLDADP